MNNKEEKAKTQTELDSFVVDVCKDVALQPFSNTFHFEGENPAQRKLGELFGVIKSNDNSEESAYLPNLLSQVIKREFFLKPNRGTEESFESALNKINLALADLAQHEVTSWIDNLDVVIGIMKDNQFHFTKLGNGHIFLSKNKTIVDISEGLNEYENIHPVKTFSDISSGELSLDDKIIFSTQRLFDSLSLEEITRHTKTFTSNEFDNILKSTLDLEGENVGAIVVNIKEKSIMPIPKKKQSSGLNFFGESKDLSTRTSLGNRCKSLKDLNKKDGAEEKEEIKASEKVISSLIPKKTQGGEISIQNNKISKDNEDKEGTKQESVKRKEEIKQKDKIGSSPISPFEEQPELFIKEEEAEEKFELKDVDNDTNQSFDSILTKAKQAIDEIKKGSIKADSIPLISKLKINKSQDNIKDMSFDSSISYLTEPTKEAKEKERLDAEKEKERERKKKMRGKNEKIRLREEESFSKKKAKKTPLLEVIKGKFNEVDLEKFILNLKKFLKKIRKFTIEVARNVSDKLSKKGVETLEDSSLEYERVKTTEKVSFKEKFRHITGQVNKSTKPLLESIKQKDWEISKKRVLRLMKRARKHKKLLAIGAIIFLLLITIPFLFKGKRENIVETLVPEKKISEPTSIQLSNKVETTTIANLENEIVALTGDKDEVFAYTKDDKFFRLNITNNDLKEIPLKNSVREIKTLVSMPTLRLIFLISEKDVFSFSPVMNRLTDVNIRIPQNISIGGAGVYLQYLYILDKNSRNVYQFPRKPGGFHNPKARITNQEFFSSAVDLAVDDSILVASEDGEIQQYFEGKLKTSLSAKNPEVTETRIVDIETKTDPNHIYALDAENGMLLKISKDRQEDRQIFFNEEFTKADHFWINQKQDRAFVSTKDGKILRVNLQ